MNDITLPVAILLSVLIIGYLVFAGFCLKWLFKMITEILKW
jgi:hypothetical protein